MRNRRVASSIEDTWQTIYSLVMYLFDSTALLFGPRKQARPDSVKNVLIVRLDAIGDFILWLDAAKEIRRLFPPDQYRLTLLGNFTWTPLAKSIPLFDEVLSLKRSRFCSEPAYRHKILKRIRRAAFDIVIQPTASREFLLGDSVVRYCGANERIGHEGDFSNIPPFLKRISDTWYTRLIHASGKPLMELERNAEFLRGLGLTSFRGGIPDLRTFRPLPPSVGSSGYYVLFPGAGLPIKRWAPERFADLATRIHKATGWTGIVCGGPGEEGIGETLLHGSDAPLENRSGRTSLWELISIIDGAHLVVSNDTSAIHIAAAVSTPSLCILGGGHYGRFVPYRVESPTGKTLPHPVASMMDCYHCNWNCIYDVKKGEPAPCVRDVSVDAAWETIQQILARIPGKRIPTDEGIS